MSNPNTDLAIMESRMAAAKASPCASAVSHHGRRAVVAVELRCRRAEQVPANDDEQAADPLADKLKRIAKGEEEADG